MNRYIIVIASQEEKECWNQQTLEWLRRTSLQILATGYKPTAIFHGVDKVSSTTAALLAGGLDSVQWVIPCAQIIDDENAEEPLSELIEALSTSIESAQEYLCSNHPPLPFTNTPSVFEGVTGIIVIPCGLGGLYKSKRRGYLLWSCGSAHITYAGKDYAKSIPRTCGTPIIR